MKTIIVLILFFGVFTIQAQSIERQVIGSTGGTVSVGSVIVSSTIGEVGVSTLSSSSILLTEGYQQSNTANPISIPEIENRLIMKLYPNPTTNNSKLEITTNTNTTISVSIYSTDGKLIESNSVQMLAGVQSSIPLYVSAQASGVYFVRIKENNNSPIKTLRLVKY